MAVMAPKEAGPLRYVPDYRLRMAGAESNLAAGLCRLGHSAGWISRLGDDEMGRFVLNSVRAEGVDTCAVKTDGAHRTGLMLKETGSGETRVYYYRENSAASHLSPEDLEEEYLHSARIIHLTGITPVLSGSCEAVSYTHLVGKAEDKRALHQQFGADICEMEAAAVVLTCNRNKVPCLLLKAVSDSIHGGAEEFSKAITEASQVCLKVLCKVVGNL